MRILAVDPGSANIGIAVLDGEELLYCDRLNYTSKHEKFNEKMNDILNQVYLELLRLITKYEVTNIAWEIVPAIGGFGNKDKVVSVSALLKSLAFHYELPFQGVFPVNVKKVMTGNPKATKINMRERVLELYPYFKEQFPNVKTQQWDTYDAILIGRTAVHHNKWVRPQSSNLTGKEW